MNVVDAITDDSINEWTAACSPIHSAAAYLEWKAAAARVCIDSDKTKRVRPHITVEYEHVSSVGRRRMEGWCLVHGAF